MKGITPHIANEFCNLCDWAFHSNQIHRHLFDDNQYADELNKSNYGVALAHLSMVTLEYSLLQVAKLHDKAITAGNITLGIDYIVIYGGWDKPVLDKLVLLRGELELFASKLRHVRNKALSHNDFAAILAGGVLGTFEKDEDVGYFAKLEEFANLVSETVTGNGFSYSGPTYLTRVGIFEMMSALKKSIDV